MPAGSQCPKRMRSGRSKRLAVDVGDEVARLDARLIGRAAIHRRDNFHKALFLRDFDTETAKLTLGLGGHIIKVFGVQIAGMGVQ